MGQAVEHVPARLMSRPGGGSRRYVPRPEASSLASLAAGSLTLRADSRSDMAAALWRTLDLDTAAIFQRA